MARIARTITTFFDCPRPWRKRIGPAYCGGEFFGRQSEPAPASQREIGTSLSILASVKPLSIAAV